MRYRCWRRDNRYRGPSPSPEKAAATGNGWARWRYTCGAGSMSFFVTGRKKKKVDAGQVRWYIGCVDTEAVLILEQTGDRFCAETEGWVQAGDG